MVKALREKKLAEVVGKSEPFNPTHPTEKGKEDPASPNQYVHKEEKLDEVLGGTYHRRILDPFKRTLGALNKRNEWLRNGQQSMKGGGRYTTTEEKKEVELGPTDTGETGETVTTNPTDNSPSATGSMNKNTNTKEIKEKKNATMG